MLGVIVHAKKYYAHKILLCFVLGCLGNNQFTHILQGYFTGTWAIIWLPQY